MRRSLQVLVRLVSLLIVGFAVPAMAQQSTQLHQVTPWDPVESLSGSSQSGPTIDGAVAPPPLSTSAWTFWGPAPIASGQRPGGGPVSGRLAGIAADPTDPNTIYVAAAGGGVWKTTNGGTTWAPLTDGQATLSMGAIAIAPSNHLMLYAGTGEANNSGDSNFGRGILVSTDGGATWTLTTGPGGTFNTNRMTTSRIAVHPTDPNTAYAAMANFGANGNFGASTGIYKTTNGGATWINVTAANGKDSTDPWSDVVIDPTFSTTIYAAVGDLFGATGNGVYKSTDGGVTWNLLPAFANGTSVGRISLAISASNSLVVYAAMQDPRNATFGQLVKMQRSDNGGGSITDLTAGTPDYMDGQGWYDTTLIVDPTNSAIVYAAGAAGSGSLNTNSVLRSTNSGASWTNISSGPSGGPHADHHAAAFDAVGRYLDGDDGGLYRLDDPVAVTWTQLNGNLGTIQFQGIGLHPTNGNVALGGSQDNGTSKFNNDLSWTLVEGGDGGFAKWSSTACACTGDGRAYHIAPVGSFGSANFFRRSDNGGTSWLSKTSGFVNTNTFEFYAPFVVDPGNGNRLLTGGDRMYETTNAADLWTAISAPGVGGWTAGNLTAIGLAASDLNTVYGATTNPTNLFVTSNHGANWTNRPLPVAGFISDIQVDPTTPLTAYATVAAFTSGGNVFKTVSGGATWTNISGNLPGLPVWSLQLDKANNILYVGADDGVYSSSNGGTTWSRFGTGLPNAQVFQVHLNTTTNILGAATHGRGAWAISTATAPVVTITNVTSLTANGSYGVGAVISIQVTFSGVVNVTGTPLLALNSGGTASYASGSGTNTLTFVYTVAAGQNSADLDYTSTSALSLNGGTIKDAGGNNAVLTLPTPGAAGSLGANKDIVIDTIGPSVTNVTSLTANGSYGVGAVISIQVTLSEIVNVTGTPLLALNSGGTASYASGSGTNTLTFVYTVAAGQNSADLDYTSTSALSLNGGTIKDAAGNSAVLTLPTPGAAGSLGANKNIVIDTVAPAVLSYKVMFGTQSFTVPGGRTRLPWTTITGIQVTFSEPVNGNASSLTGIAVTGVSGSGTSTLTWTFSALTLATYNTKVLGTTANAVKDIAGNPLGGGVDFPQVLNVLPGDVSDDGFVASNDMVLVNSGRTAPYNVFNDINGDGVVDINDVNAVRARLGTHLP